MRASRTLRIACLACVGWLIVAASAEGRAPAIRPVPVPAGGRPLDTSHPSRVVGRGTPASCTPAAVVAAVRAGGIIRFSCGAGPVTIRMNATAKVMNTSREVVLDEGGLVVQNLTFTDGNSTGHDFDGGGGGAIFDRGGRLRIVNSVFTGNRCERDGPDIGGAAVRALSQYRNLPVYVTGSRFTGNACSNGAALSSIGVSWTVLNSRFTGNRAIGSGANPATRGTPGGGSGGAIYNDGDLMRLSIAGCVFTDNHANEGGGAIFFVSDDRSGTMSIRDSTLEDNPNDRFHTPGLPGIFFLGARPPTITGSVLR
jgi:predicted outer membrane repeat protein